VHQSSLVDPTTGHTKISSNSNTTSITLNECSTSYDVTLNVNNAISGGDEGGAYSVTVLAENTTTGSQTTYTDLSSTPFISGLSGAGYSFTTTVVANSGYQFTSGPSFSNTQPQIGFIGTDHSSVSLSISGNVGFAPFVPRLLVTTQGGGDPSGTDSLCALRGDGPWATFNDACRCGVQTSPLESVYYDPADSNFGLPNLGAKLYADEALTTPFTGLGTDFDSNPGSVGLTTRTGFVKYYTYSTITSCNFGIPCTTATYKFDFNYDNETLVDVEFAGIADNGNGLNASGCCVLTSQGPLGCTNF